MIDEFSPELIERCALKALLVSNDVNAHWDAIPSKDTIKKYSILARAILRESGYAKLVAALRLARPYIIQSCGDMDPPAPALTMLDSALSKAGS